MPSVSVVPHGNGFRVVWREGGRGSKRHWSETRDSKKDAAKDADVIRARLLAAKPITAGRVRLTWGEVVERWRLSRPEGRYREESAAVLNALPWKATDDATADAISKLKLGTRRLVNSVLHYARRILKQVVDLDGLDLPMPRSSKPAKREPDLLPDRETDALVQEARRWSLGNGAIAHICATYGHRAASLVAMTGDAVDLRRGTITITAKGGRTGTHDLHPRTVEILRELKPKKGQPLFINHLGVPWKTGKHFSQWFYHRIGPLALGGKRKPGRKVGYYQTKSSAITSMLEACGNDAKTVSSITLHKRPSLLLDVYARTNRAKQLQALKGARPAG